MCRNSGVVTVVGRNRKGDGITVEQWRVSVAGQLQDDVVVALRLRVSVAGQDDVVVALRLRVSVAGQLQDDVVVALRLRVSVAGQLQDDVVVTLRLQQYDKGVVSILWLMPNLNQLAISVFFDLKKYSEILLMDKAISRHNLHIIPVCLSTFIKDC